LLFAAALSLGLLWVASSIAAGKGLIVFAAGLPAIAWTLAQARRSERRPFYRLFTLTLLAAATVLALEAVLQLFPAILSGRLANYTFNGYHAERGGIYRPDGRLGLAMKPGFRRRMHWNGHWWTHETNEGGYRGPRLAKADAVFLGDSMVYGHGLEADQTVPAQFARLSGATAANLGQPAICLIQSLMIFEDKGAALRPRQVFVCVHHNDAQDALDVYPVNELEAFVRDPRQRPRARTPPRSPSLFDMWAQEVAAPLLGARLINGLRHKKDWVFDAPAPGREERAASGPYVPSRETREADYPPASEQAPPELRLGWQANRQALAELHRLVVGAGGTLTVFDLGYPRGFTEAVESMTKDIGAGYSAAGRGALERAVAGEPIYLPNDGHWTAAGSELIARELLRER
jgi:hypothetical protein